MSMKKIFITLLLSTILLADGIAQQISETAYNKIIISEDFNTEGDFFPIITTTDNYFILDKGDYLLSRNNKESEFAIIANNSSINDFVLKTSLRIGPNNNKTASIGVIIKAQQNGKGAIIFEVNKKGEYRIKQLLGNTYKKISGSSKNEGWVRNKIINAVDEHNFVEIRTENNIYDIYVNSNYLTTFFIPDYTSGSCGIIISSETKARIAYYHINTKGGNEQSIATYNYENTTNVNATIERLNKKIEILERNNTTLNNLNTESIEDQDKKISKLTQNNADLDAVSIEQKKEISNLERSITDLRSNNSKIIGLEKTISDNTVLISELNTKKNTLTNDVAALTETTTLLDTKNTNLAATNVKQKEEITSLKNSATNTNSTISNLTSEKKESTSKINSLTIKSTDLSLVNIEQEKEIKILSATLANLESNNTKATSSNKKLAMEVADLKKIITIEKSKNKTLTNDLTKSNSSLNASSTQLNKEISSLKQSVNTLKKEKSSLNTDLTAEKTAHKKTKNGFSESVENKSTEIKELSATLTNLILKNADAIASNKELAIEVTYLKKQITIEKSKNKTLTNDLTKSNSSLNASSTQLNKEISSLKQSVNTLKKEKSSLNTDLTAEKTAKSNTKSELSELKENKSIEIKGLKTKLKNVNFQLKKANRNNTTLAECASNSANLTVKLRKATQEINSLETIKNNQDDIVSNLNRQLSAVKTNVLQQKEDLKTQDQTLVELKTKNIELKELFILIRNSNSFNLELADAELKELFVQKDFEISGVKPSDLTTKTYPTPKQIEDGNSTIYAVQFGVYMQVQPYAALKGLNEVWYETTEHETYVYLSGQFKSPQEATVHKNSLITLGYPNAFVVTLTK